MPSRGERPSQAPVEERLRAAFQTSAQPLVEHLHGLGEPHYDRFCAFMEGIATNGTIIFWGTKRYDQDMERAGQNAMRRPFGIEMGTLTPSMQVILYPMTVYKPDDEQRAMAKEEGYEVREEGTQTMVYFLDEFEGETGRTHDLAANLVFVSHMVDAALKGRYPFEQGERSTEFAGEVRGALSDAREYIGTLTPEQRATLSPRVARIALLDDEGLAREAQRRVLYDAEPMKAPGLYEPGQPDIPQLTPAQAVQNGELYLKLDERELPQRVKGRGTTDVPSSPWTEHGKNRWNRSHQLFGRYEAPIADGDLRVDFRLDSTHMPALYGFFDTIEVTRTNPEGICEHSLLGQEMGEKANLAFLQFFGAKLTPEQLQNSVIPVIIAGNFDFANPQTRELLEKLAADKGTKPDVGRVIADVLRLSAEGRLQRIQQREENQ